MNTPLHDKLKTDIGVSFVSVMIKQHPEYLNQLDSEGKTPLDILEEHAHFYSEADYEIFIKYLREKGAKRSAELG